MTPQDLVLILFFFLFTSIGIRWWIEYLEWHTLPVVIDKHLLQIMDFPRYPVWLAVLKYAFAFLGHIFFVWILPLHQDVSFNTLVIFEFLAVVSGSFLGAMFWFFTSYIIDKNYHKTKGRDLDETKIVCHVIDRKCVTPFQVHLAYTVLLGAVIFISSVALFIWTPLLIDLLV